MITMTRSGAEFWWNTVAKKNIHIPKNVVSYYKNHSHEDWKTITWEEVHRDRSERIKYNIQAKREPEFKVKPCYIWVFYNPSWIFHGYYTYIKTLSQDFAINFRAKIDDHLVVKIMSLYPCGVLPMVDNFYLWMEKFSVEHAFPSPKKKINAIAKAWVKYDRNGIMDISSEPDKLI